MKVLVCFDVDGTLETSQGPVPLSRLEALRSTPGCAVAIVSPSPAWPIGRFPYHTQQSRDRNLLDALNAVLPDAELKLYVSNNRDYLEARAAGFIYVEAAQF